MSLTPIGVGHIIISVCCMSSLNKLAHELLLKVRVSHITADANSIILKNDLCLTGKTTR